MTVEFTADGYLRLEADLAASRFPSDAVAAVVRDDDLWLHPAARARAAAGCCSSSATRPATAATLVREVLADRIPRAFVRHSGTMHRRRCGFPWAGARGPGP